jgi:Aromatic acid exporter family member 1
MLRAPTRLTRAPRRVVGFLQRPATQTDLLQIAKTVVAAVAAWLLAVNVFGLMQPFLAPWAALLTVHATVYRSFSRGAQSVMATAMGIVVSFTVAELLGLGAATLGIALFMSLVLSRAGLLRDEGVTVATTALFVLTTGYEHQESMLLDRFLDTAIGVAVGIVANLVILPPLNDRSAQQQVDRINEKLGGLLREMAEEMRSDWSEERSGLWIDATRSMDDDLDHAWRLVRHAHESGWWNPRRRLSSAGDPTQYEQVLQRLEEGIAQARSMARIVHESTRSAHEWDSRFRGPWVDLLDETGRRVANPDANVKPLHKQADDLTRELSGEDLPGLLWPVYGALISNLINVIDIVDDVATSRPVRT